MARNQWFCHIQVDDENNFTLSKYKNIVYAPKTDEHKI